MATWASVAARAERWLLPPECLVCQTPLAGGSEALVCEICQARWRAIDSPSCRICGEPMALGLACRLCSGWPPDFGPVRSAVRLDAPVRALIHRFKYQGWWRLAESFATRMAPLVHHAGDVDLVPVPLAAARRAIRGYNQAEHLAIALARITGLPVRQDRLQRIRDTPTQTRLAPEGRRANLAEAFAAADGHRPVILVDDVFTTGATLCSAAVELLDRGAERVGAVTFARAEPRLTDAAAKLR